MRVRLLLRRLVRRLWARWLRRSTVSAVFAPEVTFSRHAVETMRRRDVSEDEVSAVVRRPEFTYPSYGKYVFEAGDLAVVLDPAEWHVVTVLKRRRPGDPRWTDEEVRRRGDRDQD